MTFAWLHASLLSVAAMLWSATLSPTTPPALAPAPPHPSLAGDLLIASPQMTDPRFRHAVILMVKQDAGGALGIVINRPIATLPLARLLKATGADSTGVTGDVRIFAGGPLSPQAGFILHSAEYRIAGTIAIDGRVAMTLSPQILQDIGHGHGPAKSLIAFGYAGWGPGQLDRELARGGWFLMREDPKLVFDDDRARVWDDAMARRARPL